MRKALPILLPLFIVALFSLAAVFAGNPVGRPHYSFEQVMNKTLLDKSVRIGEPKGGKFFLQVLPTPVGLADKVIQVEQDYIIVENAGGLTHMVIPVHSIGSITSYRELEQ